MAPFKNLVLLAVLVVLAVQLEFIFHISEPLLYHWRQLLERLVNTVFIVGFLLWVYLAYEIEKLKRLLCEYSYINYKKSDEWEREIATTTNEELRKLTDSEEYKQWQRARKQHREQPTSQELDHVELKFIGEIERAVFGEDVQPSTVETTW